MGGYMGFGMLSWKYKERPRKVFSKRRRKPTCNTLPDYNRTFKLQPSKQTHTLATLITLFLLGAFFTCFYFKAPAILEQSNKMYKLKQERIERNNDIAFRFLMNSGISRLRGQNFVGAYSEFKLAHAIYPEDKTVNELLLQTLYSLCEEDQTYCSEMDQFLKVSL
ncbi:hypothetical protein [uncultured Psychroserpens sp.]|uniref:hypothetical protein n=1 Tax=uncultured Psychroserpens sp. TaxID=255436 RepID=UPI002609837D|nr:hypothetical protein [uncultured Psychroserpens sp.]